MKLPELANAKKTEKGKRDPTTPPRLSPSVSENGNEDEGNDRPTEVVPMRHPESVTVLRSGEAFHARVTVSRIAEMNCWN